jgi:hypothetical protein
MSDTGKRDGRAGEPRHDFTTAADYRGRGDDGQASGEADDGPSLENPVAAAVAGVAGACVLALLGAGFVALWMTPFFVTFAGIWLVVNVASPAGVALAFLAARSFDRLSPVAGGWYRGVLVLLALSVACGLVPPAIQSSSEPPDRWGISAVSPTCFVTVPLFLVPALLWGAVPPRRRPGRQPENGGLTRP